MFLNVKKSPMLYLQHKDMDSNYIMPVTSSLRINMQHVAETSIYVIKEEKQRFLLDNSEITVPVGTNVIHLVMSYTHSTHQTASCTVNQRYFYKLIFLPGADAEFLRLKQTIERLTYE